jgi:phage baseplate assembly protein W
LTFGAKNVLRRTTDQVVKLIQAAQWENVSAFNEDGYLVFVDRNTVGPKAFVKVRGTAASALGFGQPHVSGRQWAAYGREIYPGWDLYLRPDEITNRFIRFRKPLKTNPMLKVTYSVPVQRCLRCQATFVENDFRFNQNGTHITIQNENLLYQAALKILLTDRGSNPFHPWYGTSIRDRIGSKALMGVSSVLSEDVRNALGRMQTLQTEQAKYQMVTFKERLYGILGVNVKRHQQDQTTFLIEVTVQNAAADPISLDIVFTVPEVVALMGTNGLMLGTRASGLDTTEVRAISRNDRNTLTGDQ